MPPESAQRPTGAASTPGQLPIFVISLATNEERRARIVATLADLDLQCTLVDAVDARQGVPPEHETSIDRVGGASLSGPEYGCALSHALIYRRMVAEQIPHAIVLEEDAIPTARFAQFVREEEYRSSPLIQLYHQAAYVRRSGARSLTGGIELARLATSCSGTVAYSLDLGAAVALEAATSPVRSRADWPLDLRDLGACVTRPILVEHPPEWTSSVIDRSRSRQVRGPRRLLTRHYWRIKLRRLFAKRVRGHRVARS